MFDLDTQDLVKLADDGEWMILKHATTKEPILIDDDETKSPRLKLVGRDSKIYRAAMRDLNARKVAKVRNNRNAAMNNLDSEKVIEETCEILAQCTLAVENIQIGGEVWDWASRDVIEKLYRRFPQIREQADDFISDRSNFLKS